MNNQRISKLGLGTAQFGMDYGISNQEGRTSKEEVRRILDLAHNAGIRCLDTASQYGDSEQVLGETMPAGHGFKIITKTPHFKADSFDGLNVDLLKDTLQQSLDRLMVPAVYGLMVHNADDLMAPGGDKLFQAMLELKDSGQVQKIGASVYTAAQIDAVVGRYEIDLIQVPVNVLDQRLILSGHLKALKNLGVEVHVRSVFLQGLLLMEPKDIPEYFSPVIKHLEKFNADCNQYSTKPIFACLDFVLNLPETDRIIVGVCSQEELEEIIYAANQNNFLPDYSGYDYHDETILNPANWKI